MPAKSQLEGQAVVLSVLGRLPTLHCAAALAPQVRLITDVRRAVLRADEVPLSVVESVRPAVVGLTFASRYTPVPLRPHIDAARAELFDALAARRLAGCDLLDCWSSSSLETMRRARRRGAHVVLNRGSTHILHQLRVLSEEHARWGVRGYLPSSRTVERELEEYELADIIVVPSGQAAETFAPYRTGFKAVAVNVTGVDHARFAKAGGEAGEPQPKFIFIGLDAIRKGLADALDGWILAGKPGRFVVVSAAPSWMLRRYRHHGIEFAGAAPSVHHLFAGATALVFPSLEEGHARVLLEALASGVPVIATRESGAEDLPPSPAVTIVPVRDPHAVAGAIAAIMVDANLPERRLTAQRIASAFTWERYVQEHVSLYENAAF